MAYDCTDLTAFEGVMVFCEQRGGKLMSTDFELISEGRKLADERNVELTGVLLGDGVEGLVPELGGYGADEVIVYKAATDHFLIYQGGKLLGFS